MRNWLSRPTSSRLFLLAVLVGLGGAVGAALFHGFIFLTTLIFYGQTNSGVFISTLETMPIWQRILIPTIGGLLVGIIFKLAKVNEAEGEGVPEVMEALAHHKGTIRPIVAPVKIITAALTLGSGGSAGREGPVIQIGSAIGSSIGQWFKVAPYEKSLLLAAGAAAAIGGTFGAPLAGILFTYEILKHKPAYRHLFYVATAATVSFSVTSYLIGSNGLRFDTDFLISLNTSLVTALLLVSLLSAGAALSFGNILSFGKAAFSRIYAPHFLKPALGGFAIGLIGIAIPYIHEPAAYPIMVDLLSFSSFSITILIILLFTKMVATAITLGSGGSGGIFAPLLLIGAIVGAIVTGITDTSSLAVIIVAAMAATFAAAAHAPLTAAVICFEVTDAPIIALPIFLLVAFLATFIAKLVSPTSVYQLPHPDSNGTT